MKAITWILIFLLTMQIASAQIAIRSFGTNPSVILPGKQVQLSMTIENVGDTDIEDIVIKLDLSQVPFAPVNSASEKAIEKIKDGDETSVQFDLVALPDASSQIYKIPVEISYNNITTKSLVSLTVAGEARLDVVLESSDIVKVGDNGKVIAKFVNNGLTDVKFLTLKLLPSNDYELLSADTIYIGQIDVDDFDTAEFTIIANKENPSLLFNVDYKDASNKVYNQNKVLRLNVYSLEEAKQLGLVTGSRWTWIVGVILGLVVLFLIYRRFRRKKL